MSVQQSDAGPCPACPWRLSNQVKRHPDGWYTKANLKRLWAWLRNGNGMTCHPTDPGNEVSPAAQAAGYKPAPPGSTVLECRGAVILQQRELHKLTNTYDCNQRAYRAARPAGLTRIGVMELMARIVFGGVPLIGGLPMARPNLNADDVGYERLPWDPAAGDGAPVTGGQP